MNDPKVLFVKQFLATLFQENVQTIPINNSKFKDGIDGVARYFKDNIDQFGPYANKLELLFLKYSTRGEYRQFSKVIESFNGRIVSLENPYYVKANIKLENDYADELIRNRELGIAPGAMEAAADCFRRRAGLN